MLEELLPVGLTLWVNHEGPPPTIVHHDRIVNRQTVGWQALRNDHDQLIHHKHVGWQQCKQVRCTDVS